jgi:hypothetical protein
MLKYQNTKIIDSQDLDDLVVQTYGRPYCFQQQDGCQSRGSVSITIPTEWNDDFKNDTIPEVVNGEEMGVSFKAWLERDPKQPLPGKDDQNSWSLDLFWTRNFYPGLQTVCNDLHAKGLIEAGNYEIKIDW